MPPPDPHDLHILVRLGLGYAIALVGPDAGGRDDEAWDLVQEACLRIAQRGGPWHIGYLRQAIRSNFIDRLRRSSRRRFEREAADADDPGIDPPAPQADIAARLAEVDLVERAVALLTPAQREVIVLWALDGLTAQEIADLTGRSRGTVLTLLHRARHGIAARLTVDGDRIDGGATESPAPVHTQTPR
jgi:RNA polymerase sigma factor (sigma-70 family)